MRGGRRFGGMLVELLVGLIVIMVISAGLFNVFAGSFASRQTAATVNDSVTQARRPIDILADHLRNAQRFDDGTVTAAVFQSDGSHSTDATHIVYGTSGNAKVCYYLDAGALKRSDSTGTTTVLSGVTSLNFTYYTMGINYYWSGPATPTGNPNAPATSELPHLCSVKIDAAVTVSGRAQSFTTYVRLRNSPSKSRL